jgi:hypothetical protein
MLNKYMTVEQCIEYLNTTSFSDTVHQQINVYDVSAFDSDGIPFEDKYFVMIQLIDLDDESLNQTIFLKMVRDSKPFYFRSLSRVFNDFLWKRCSQLHMMGNIPQSFIENEYFS